jgi:hypothetical protein
MKCLKFFCCCLNKKKKDGEDDYLDNFTHLHRETIDADIHIFNNVDSSHIEIATKIEYESKKYPADFLNPNGIDKKILSTL